MSNVVIAPDEDWVVVVAVAVAELGLAPQTGVITAVGLSVLLPAVLLVTTANVVEFDDELEAAKDGSATALEGSTSLPVPQGITTPFSVVEFVAVVVAPVDEAMANRPVPVQVKFIDPGEVN